jgi:hypothetical protein
MLKGPMDKPSGGASNMDLLASEQVTLQTASKALDGLVQQAMETRLVLQEQTVYMQAATNKVEEVNGFLPQVNRAITKITGRKWRDLIILGGFISACICALLLYYLSFRKQ